MSYGMLPMKIGMSYWFLYPYTSYSASVEASAVRVECIHNVPLASVRHIPHHGSYHLGIGRYTVEPTLLKTSQIAVFFSGGGGGTRGQFAPP